MAYSPHTPADITAMLATLGVASITDLFDEIPAALRTQRVGQIPSRLTELEISQFMRQRANQDTQMTCFVGAGAYEHYIPAVVWDLATRGEFYSAYTPYQAEASQGTLQVVYEFQTMLANLLGMEVANASLYDGASALAEAILMAVRLHKSSARRVLVPTTLNPRYRHVIQSIVTLQNIELIDLPFDTQTGTISVDDLNAYSDKNAAALIIPQPNFFGGLEAVDELTDWAHAHNLLVIGAVNPLALAILSPPGEWGKQGADIACGEGQPLGIPLAGGGPYFGFMCCKKMYIRQLPGRIVGQTVDRGGNTAYTLTLQAREQHIRRSKATSNICTNQGLMVTAATVYLALLGARGLEQIAWTCHAQTTLLMEKLTALPGVKHLFTKPFFHETVIQLNKPVAEVLAGLAKQNILGGYNLYPVYPELGQSLLICATEMRTVPEIDNYIQQLETVLCCFKKHI